MNKTRLLIKVFISRPALMVFGFTCGLAIAEGMLRLGFSVGDYLPEHMNNPGRVLSSYKPEDAYRIVVLGDSMAEGREAWPARTERILREEAGDRKVEVDNLSLDGIGPYSYNYILRLRGLSLHPDLVVVMFNADNDVRDVMEILEEPAWYRRLRVTLRQSSYLFWFIRESWLRKLRPRLRPWHVVWRDQIYEEGLQRGIPKEVLKRRMEHIPTEVLPKEKGPQANIYLLQIAVYEPGRIVRDLTRPDPEYREAERESMRILTRMYNEVVGGGSHMVLVVAPPCYQVNDECARFYRSIGFAIPENVRSMDQTTRLVMDWAASKGVPALDLGGALRRLPTKGLYRQYDMHWSMAGHERVAEAVTRFLRKQVFSR